MNNQLTSIYAARHTHVHVLHSMKWSDHRGNINFKILNMQRTEKYFT